MSKGRLLAVSIVWLMIVGAVAVSWRLFFKPTLEQKEQAEREQVIAETSGNSRYQHTLDFALDQFSGYAILRSEVFREELKKQGIRLRLVDDQADYVGRLRKLQSGEIPLATFTIDALIKASAELKDLPAVIVSIIDETRGADAMVAAKGQFPNVDALNHPETRFVLTPDSPSETLARVVMSHFSLDRLASNPFRLTKSPEETLERYRNSSPSSREVFVIWEPYVSEILENSAMHVVVDSSRFRGYIVDCIVVNREYLLEHESVVRDIVGSYFSAAYQYRQAMVDLVLGDARQLDQPLSANQAERLVAGIRWKNTLENFSHFGIVSDGGLQYIEDMIANLTSVLQRTGGITQDPTGGVPAKLYNERILRGLRETNFHPGLAAERIEQERFELPVLSAKEWGGLRQVGELKVPSLVFARGTVRLTSTSQATLDDLVRTLNTWPQYYVLVRGNASRQGDLEANRILAENRAQAAATYLIQKGIHESRIHAVGADPSGETSVSFVLGEAPY